MTPRRSVSVVNVHAGGEVGNVVVGGVAPPPGDTVFEQMLALRGDDGLRRFLLREPRGSVATHANLVVPSKRQDCAYGFVIMEPTEYPMMSGSNTICVATVLLETGMVEMVEPETTVRLETPAGVVEVRAHCRDGRVETVAFTNVPSYATKLDEQIEVPGLGTVTIDVAFGGMWYAIADADELRFELRPDEASALCEVGEAIRVAAREQVDVNISIVQIAGPWQGVNEVSKNAVVIAPGRLDRSATGTGLSARMAVLHARGLMQVGDVMTHASPIGSTFDGFIVAETAEGIVPAIRGSAFVMGRSELYVDERDPFPQGYLLTDTWPGADVQD